MGSKKISALTKGEPTANGETAYCPSRIWRAGIRPGLARDQARPSNRSKATPRQRRSGDRASAFGSSGKLTRMTTVGSVWIAPYIPNPPGR